MFNNAQMVEINEKEVKSIVLQDGGVLYEKENIITEPLILHFKGNNFQGSILSTNNVIVDWGDGTTDEYSSGERLEHTYNENTTHIITISNIVLNGGMFNQTSDWSNKTYGITKILLPNNITQIPDGTFYGALITDIFVPSNIQTIGNEVFVKCFSLKNIILSEGLKTIGDSPFATTSVENIIIPSTVTSMGASVFGETGRTLKNISFLWDSEEIIIPYNSSTYAGISPDNYTFNIPEGTTQLYVDKGYPLEKLVEGATSITSSISIQSNKTVISATNNESCILNATVLDNNSNPVENQEVTFKLGTTILDTALTDENGEATYEFEAKGNGNISVSAEVRGLFSNSLTIEDCIYAKMQQYDMVRSGSTAYGLLNDDIISDLPIQYSIEYSMKTSRHPASGSEHRLYWVPRELYNLGSQPSYAMFISFSNGPYIQIGVRRGSTSCVEWACLIDSWYNFRVDKLSDRFSYYLNEVYLDWYSFDYQYNNWTFSYIIWSDTTLSVKNIKIKPFEFNNTISIEYSEATTSYTLTATLTGNDIANRAVRFYKNNKYIGTSFTDSNGIATKTFNEIENENISFTAWCGDVESSEIIVENDISTPKIKLSADKNILSYADNESCTITATYEGETIEGQTVVFKNEETVLATKTTNSNGVATYEYESQGIGDITITVECMNLQKTYDIEDCWNTQLPEVSAGSNTVNSIGMGNVHNVQNDDFILEFDHKGNGNICIGATSQYSTPSTANYRLTLGTYDSKYYCAVRTSSADETSGSSEDNSTYYSYKIEKEGTTVKFYANNVLIATKTASFFTNYDAYSIYNIKWGGGTDYMKNIRLKPL